MVIATKNSTVLANSSQFPIVLYSEYMKKNQLRWHLLEVLLKIDFLIYNYHA